MTVRLLASPTSPYARKVRAALIETGLDGTVALVAANPLEDPADLHAANPLGKVPCLVLADGTPLFDSRVICAWIDGQRPGVLVPADAGRLAVARGEALADGIMDAALNLVMERRRPEGERSPLWQVRWRAAIGRGVAALSHSLPAAPPRLDGLAAAAALAYLDFRLPDLAWRDGASDGLVAWFTAAVARPAFAKTAPPA